MPIDTSIYQQLRQAEMPSMLDSATRAMNLSHLARQNRQLKQTETDQEAVRGAFKRNIGLDGEINRGGVLSDLAKNSPLQALEYKTKFAQMDATQADAQKKVLEDRLSKFSAAYRIVGRATDQASYDQMKQEAKAIGLPIDSLPPQYNPAYVKDLMAKSAMLTLDAKHGLDAIKTISEVGINEKKAPLDRQKTQAEIRKLNGETGEQRTKLAGSLRQERSGLPTTKATQDVAAAYNRVQQAAKVPSAAGDMALLYGFNKMLDPGSVVRETEFANAAAAGGVSDRIAGLVLRVSRGERLSPEQRADFLNQSQKLWEAQNSQQGKIDKDFTRLAQQQGVNPEDVIVNFGADLPGSVIVQAPGAGVPGVDSVNAGGGNMPKAPPAPKSGAIVMVDGIHYRVDADGDTLLPIKSSGSVGGRR